MLVQMVLMPFGIMLANNQWIQFFLTTVIMLISARPFITSALASFKKHHSNMDTLVAVGSLATYGYSIYALLTHQPVYFESAALVVTFVLLGQVFEERMRSNASNAVEKLLNLQAKDAEVLRKGEYKTIPITDVRQGDIIRVRPGQKIPLDGTIIC